MTPSEKERYSRQILFPAIGETGQTKIRSATVCIVGCGALGTFQAEALTRAGIGRLRIIDRDYVDWTNLQRQSLYEESDAARETPKAIAAARRLKKLNSAVEIEPLVQDVTYSNAQQLLFGVELILDGTDNFETRYLLNDVSIKFGIPWIYGSAVGSYGIVMPIIPEHGPCLACVYPEPPTGAQPTCDVNGVLAPAAGCVALTQVAKALRILVGWPDFSCVIQHQDVWTGSARAVRAEQDPQCTVCVNRRFAYLDGRKRKPVSLCGRNAVQLHENGRPLDLRELATRLRALGDVRVNEFALRMTLSKFDLTFFPDGRAIVKGTTDVAVARSLYAKLIGS